ncbi:MAG: FG-GAP-like repeat-containing protein, partial [Planctomycetota bacterium]|nr:FG-GAP-like repeat-containing protein [Planctomycetota bacterium]
DGYGDFDIALCNSGTSRFGTTGQPRLYLNDGGGRFTDATTGRIPTGNIAQQMDILFLDADGDFDLDLFVGTRATTPNQSRLWLNNGAGVFTAGGNFPNDATCYAYDAGDIDSDGDLDLIGTNAGTSNTELLAKNWNGLGTSWINVSASISPNPMVDDNDSKFFDIDNDGDLDLVIAVLGGTKRIYRNSGTGAFTQVTNIITAASDSSLDVKVADFDGDGRYDIVTGQGESGAFQNRIYMNNGPIDTLPPINVRTEQVIAGTVVGAAHPVRVELRDAYTSHMGFHARSVTLRYGTGAVLSQTVPMKLTGNCLWRGVMPAQSPGSVVSYSVRSVDAFGNTGDGPILTFTEFGTPQNPADRNGDGFVDGLDLAIILAAWGTTEVAGDANGDGFVDGVDLAIVLSAFGL